MTLGEHNQNSRPPTGTPITRITRLPTFPVRIGWGSPSDDDASDNEAHTETAPNATRTAPRAPNPTTCPIRSCLDALTSRTRRALVSHLAAKHIVHGRPGNLAHEIEFSNMLV